MIAWLGLSLFIALALVFDLRGATERAPSARQALWLSIAWTVLGAAFAVIVAAMSGGEAAGEYLTGFLIEKSLSLDNLFVFAVLFSFFGVPEEQRLRVLIFGIAGAVVLRAIFIALGAAALGAFAATTYVLGALLLVTAVRIARSGGEEIDPQQSRAMRLIRRRLPLTDTYHGSRLVTHVAGRRVGTPLLAALLLVAAFDLMFAIDSIPAIFAITRDTFVVFAANAFSLLGMVSLFFLLDRLLARFRYLHLGLAAILGFVGVKLILADTWHPPVWVSLAVIAACLGLAALASSLAARGSDIDDPHEPAGEAPAR